MGFMSEYISRRLSAADLESELLQLISNYNKLRNTFAIVYVAAIGKPIPDISLSQDDYYLIHDLVRDTWPPDHHGRLHGSGTHPLTCQRNSRYSRSPRGYQD